MTTTVTSRLRRMPPWDDRERAVLLALMGERSQTAWSALVAEIIDAGSAWAVWTARHGRTLFDSDPPEPIAEAGRRLGEWRAAGLGVHTFRDASYPAQLREIHQVPPVLFSRGDLRADEPAVSIVGSRRASERALAWTRELADALVSAGISVVSGLAAGIDTAAHTTTLDAGGRLRCSVPGSIGPTRLRTATCRSASGARDWCCRSSGPTTHRPRRASRCATRP